MLKEITNYPGHYISTWGVVFSRWGKGRKYADGPIHDEWKRALNKDKDGYIVIGLTNNRNTKTHKVHRLVAEAFISNPKNKPQINHKNGIKSDNRVENLEWCTASENKTHAYRMGITKKQTGSESSQAKLNEDQVKEIKTLLNNNILTHREIGIKYNVGRTTITEINRGNNWKNIDSGGA
jgi:hypothetical protein